jgi:hypothetical protein
MTPSTAEIRAILLCRGVEDGGPVGPKNAYIVEISPNTFSLSPSFRQPECITLLNFDAWSAKFAPEILGGGMNERPRKATRLTVSLGEQDYRTLNEIALARDASISWVIRQAIRQFIETTPRPTDQPPPPNSLPSIDR